MKNAIAHQNPISIKLDPNLNGGGSGEHTLLLNRNQIAKIERSRLIEKRKAKAKVQHQGGFLGMLAELAAKALPSILRGFVVLGAVKQAVGGDGLYLHIVSRSILFEETFWSTR